MKQARVWRSKKRTIFVKPTIVVSLDMSRLFSSLWSFVRRNKYVVVLVAFLLIIVVFDQNSLLRRMSQKREMKALQEEIDDYKRQIREGEALLETLESDSMLLEQIARERYNMSRSDEDVFIME